MNGYELTEKLRKTRRRHHLSAATQALFYELVAICNEEGWTDVFKCSNGELCTALCIDEKTLTKHRLSLIQCGLLSYKSGQSKRAVGLYSFTQELQPSTTKKETTGNFPPQTPTNPPANVPTNPPAQMPANPPTNAPDLIKTKTEIKTETEIIDGADAPPSKTFKNFSNEDFALSILDFKDLYPKEMRDSFFKYWREKNARGKMRFQLEKTWETGLRLEKWKANQEKFNQKNEKLQQHSGLGKGAASGHTAAGKSIVFDRP